jgi:alpha-tubulin suppressor-like RCC1 family protein
MVQTFNPTDTGASGDTVKTGIVNNDAKAATLQSNWSGSTAPSNTLTVIGQFWADTSTSPPVIKTLESKSPDVWKVVITQGDGQVNAATLESDAVTTAKILDLNVTTAKIALLAVDTAQLAADAVETAKIADLNVTTAKLALLSVDTAQLAASAVEAAKIASSAVTTDKINAAAVTEAKLGTGAVTNTKLGTDSVTTVKIADQNVTAAKMKATGSDPFVFGKRSTDSVPVEVPLTAIQGGAGRIISALPTKMSLGSQAMAVLTENNEIWMIGSTTSFSVPKYTGRSYAYNWTQVLFAGTPGTITNIYLTHRSGFALDDAGDVWSWGDNTYGQLGHNDTTRREFATQISALSGVNIADVIVPEAGYATQDSVMFLTDTGAVYASGSNALGQLAVGTTSQTNIATLCTGLTSISSLKLSNGGAYAHGLAIDTSGNLEGWGYNGYGQLGDGSTTNRSSPVTLTPTSVDAISVSGWNGGTGTHSIAADGTTIKGTGFDRYGQLGDATNTENFTSWQTATYAGAAVAAIETLAAYGSTIVRDTSGNLFSTGRNASGQLGLGDTADRNTFIAVTMPSTTATKHRMFAGNGDSGATVFLGADGELYGTGANSSGILAQGGTSSLSSFTLLKRPGTTTISDFVIAESDLAIGSNQAAMFMLDSEGKLFASGNIASVGIGNQMYGADTPSGHQVVVRVPVL